MAMTPALHGAALWLAIILAGVITYSIRLSFIVLLNRIDVPVWFRRSLRFVPVAVLTAIIVPETATFQATVNLTLSNPQVPAALVAVLVAWRTRNVLLTIIAGMVAFLVFQALIR
jgi:branched-subunit amino acid transport protein